MQCRHLLPTTIICSVPPSLPAANSQSLGPSCPQHGLLGFLTNNIKIYLQHGSKKGSKSGWEGHWETSQEDMSMRNRPEVWRDGRAGRKVMRKRSVTELLPHQKQAPTFFLPTLASPGHTQSCRVHRASGASRSGPSSPPCCTKKYWYELLLMNSH